MKILIIDDQLEDLNPLKEILKKQKDIDGNPYEDVIGLTIHKESSDLLKKERFDIVVVDMVGPSNEEAGLEICRQLTHRPLVVIVLTAHASIPNCVKAMRAGAWDYLEKNPDDRRKAYDNLFQSIKEGCEFRREQKDLGTPDPNASWVGENLGKLMEEHGGKYIAVYDQEVIAEATTSSELREKDEVKKLLMQPYIINIPDPNKKEI
jgi:DNA-binding NtrC family response regulator